MAISDQVRAPQGPADKKAKAWYTLPGDEVAVELGVDLDSAEEAAERLRRDGPNALPMEKPPSLCAVSWPSTPASCSSSWLGRRSSRW